MAARLPIVATNVGGVSEIVDDQIHGFLCPAKDYPALADRIVRLGRDEALRNQMGSAGQQRAHAYFSEENMHRHYEEAIASVVEWAGPMHRSRMDAA